MEAQLTAEQQRSRALQDTQAQLQAARSRMAELAAELAQQRERSQQAGSGAHGTSGLEAEHQLACLQGNAAVLSRCSPPELRRCTHHPTVVNHPRKAFRIYHICYAWDCIDKSAYVAHP